MSKNRQELTAKGRLRIVHLISGLGIGGAERTLQGLVGVLDDRGYESIVISLTDLGEIGRELQQAGFQVFSLNWKTRWFPPLGFVKLIRLVHSLKPQMIQTWMYHADLVGTLLSYWERGMGLVWNIRGSNPSIRDWPLSTRIVMRACRLLSGKPEAVIVNSEQGLLDHQAIGYRPKEWVVLHNGIDTQRFVPSQSRRTTLRKSLGLKDGDCLIGCVARFHPKKGHYFLIQSFAGLLEGADNIYLALIGRRIHEGNAELMAWIQQAGVGERVFLLGAREQSEAVYPGMDILAMPSLYGEGFPNVVAEAMSCGVPCVVSDVGDAALIVGDTGEIVAPGDVEGFSRALQQLAGTVVVKRQRLAERARDRIQSHFNLAQMLAKYDQLYRRLINPDQAH